jgi:8-oxo-dGTP diphosphatase
MRIKVVTAAIIAKDNKFLIARRAEGELFVGFWEFPGGKIETGETPEECLRRELHEEFGVEAAIGDFFGESLYEYPKGAIRLLAYRADLTDCTIRLSVHDEYQWVLADELLRFNLLPADTPLVEKLIQNNNLNQPR